MLGEFLEYSKGAIVVKLAWCQYWHHGQLLKYSSDFSLLFQFVDVTGISTVCLRVCSNWQQRKHLSSFVRRIHQWLPSHRIRNTENVSLSWRHIHFMIHIVDSATLVSLLFNCASVTLISAVVIFHSKSHRIWWRHQMESFSTLLALCVGNSMVTGEFPTQRPVTRSFDVYSDLCLNKRLCEQSRDCWFDSPSRSLWRHSNDLHRSCCVSFVVVI